MVSSQRPQLQNWMRRCVSPPRAKDKNLWLFWSYSEKQLVCLYVWAKGRRLTNPTYRCVTMVGAMVHEPSLDHSSLSHRLIFFFIYPFYWGNMSLNLLGNSCYEVSIVPPQTSLKVKENFNFMTYWCSIRVKPKPDRWSPENCKI